MFFHNLLARRRQSLRAARKYSSMLAEAASPVVEALESRRLLSTYTYYVPTGTSLVTLRGDAVRSGVVDVYLGGDFSSPAHTFDDPAGTDVIQAAGSGVTCQDQVPAAVKPSGGIVFNSGSNSTLEIDAGPSDTQITVGASDANGGSVVAVSAPPAFGAGLDTFGVGVNHLTIVPNDAGSATVSVPYLHPAIHLLVNTGAGQHDTVNIGGQTEGDSVTDADVVTGAGYDTVNVASDDDDGTTTARVDFGDGTGAGNNQLVVASGGTAHVADLAGASHVVVVDQVTVHRRGDVIVADPSTLHAVQVDLGGSLHVNAATTIDAMNLDVGTQVEPAGATAFVEAPTAIDVVTGGGTTEFTGTSAGSTITVAQPGVDNNNNPVPVVNVIADYGASLTVGGGTPAAPTSYFKTLTVAGNVYLDSPVTVTDLELSNGLVQLDQSGTWVDNPQANEIDTIHITGGLLDLDGQDLLTTTSTDTIRGYLYSAYDGGGSTAWQGTTGITSSLMNGPAYEYGIGYAPSGHPNTVPTIPSGKVLLRPTMFGDTNLDGTTDNADISAEVAAGYYNDGTGGHTWADGDWNYDGYVNNADFSALVASGTYYHNPVLSYPG